MKKTIRLLFAVSLFSFFGLDALRTNPLAGRSTWRVQRDSIFIPIEEADAVAGVINISVAGNYQLYEDLTDKEIIISVDGVVFDLNGHELATTSIDPIISVNASDVKIYNGKIRDITTATATGIKIGAGQSEVLVEQVIASDCAVGILLDGQEGTEVTNCEIISCDLVGNTVGMLLQNADENYIKDCFSTYSKVDGFKLLWSKKNIFQNCSAIKTIGDSLVAGFQTDGGKNNLFDHCIVKETLTSAEDFCNKSHGFLLTGTEEKTKIIDCIVNETDVTSTVSAVAYGIHLEPEILQDAGLLEWTSGVIATSTIYSLAWSPDTKHIVAGREDGFGVYLFDGTDIDETTNAAPSTGIISTDWSPDGKFLAVTSTDTLIVYGFGGNNGGLVQIASQDVPGEKIYSVAWSPDGKYIATGWEDAVVRVYSFDGTTSKSLLTNYFSEGATNKTLHLVHAFSLVIPLSNVISVDWSPDGRFLAWGTDDKLVGVLKFDGGQLGGEEDLTAPFVAGSSLHVDWSPSGRFIVIGESLSALTGGFVHVIAFFPPPVATTLVVVDSIDLGDPVPSVSWSPDGKYIACCHSEYLNLPSPAPATPSVSVLTFSGSTLAVQKTVTYPPRPTGESALNAVDWSPCGKYICSGGGMYFWPDPSPADRAFLEIFNAMTCPENCLVKNCSVADTQAFEQFMGTGIAGGGSSCFLNNSCCNNDVDFSYGIPNVFFGDHNDRRPFDNWATQSTKLCSALGAGMA